LTTPQLLRVQLVKTQEGFGSDSDVSALEKAQRLENMRLLPKTLPALQLVYWQNSQNKKYQERKA